MAFRAYPVPFDGPGELTLMPCPPADGLATVLDRLRAQGVTTVLSMLPAAEAAELGVATEQDLCTARGIEFLSHPIPDFGLPDPAAFTALINDLTTRLRAHQHIAVHCRAGIGRSGMVAAAMLVALGEQPDVARQIVSVARGVSIPDTVEQGRFIAEFAKRVNCDL